MRKTLLLPIVWVIALCSMNLIGQSSPAMGDKAKMHEARITVLDKATHQPIAYAGLYDKVDRELGRSDLNGLLVVSLPASANEEYIIRYPGFAPQSFRIKNADKRSAAYEIMLAPKPMDNGSAMAEETFEEQPSTTGENTELVKVYVREEPKVDVKSVSATTPVPAPAQGSSVEFAVQLSATSRPITDKTSLKTWEELGPVFIQNENGLYKVRIGPFNTQEDAKAVLLAAKSRGKKDAFIVVQQGRENHVPFNPNAAPRKPVASTEVANQTPPQPAKTETTTATTGDYKVRLASYLHPGGFSTKDIDKYGTLESYRKGEWTILMIGGFKNEADARKVQAEVIGKGFKDAAVIVERDGLLEEVK